MNHARRASDKFSVDESTQDELPKRRKRLLPRLLLGTGVGWLCFLAPVLFGGFFAPIETSHVVHALLLTLFVAVVGIGQLKRSIKGNLLFISRNRKLIERLFLVLAILFVLFLRFSESLFVAVSRIGDQYGFSLTLGYAFGMSILVFWLVGLERQRGSIYLVEN
jgi:membrane protein CcdC involved in cytochrome C biogenesis